MSLYSILYCSIPCWWQRLNPADEKPAKYIPCTQVRNLQKDTTLHILSTLLILYDRHWTAPIRQFHLSISLLTWFTNSKIIIILQQSIYYCPLSRSFSLSHIHARSHYHKLLNNVCILKCPDNVNHSKKSSKKQTSHYCPYLHNADAAAPPPHLRKNKMGSECCCAVLTWCRPAIFPAHTVNASTWCKVMSCQMSSRTFPSISFCSFHQEKKNSIK